MMLGAPFTGAVMIYAFYAMQPYLLQLYGSDRAYAIAGLAAAALAGAQIAGGLMVPHAGRVFRRRTSVVLTATAASAVALAAIGLFPEFWAAITLMMLWGLMVAAMTPVRQAYLNGLIESKSRATVLSFDSLLGSSGAAALQPPLGRVADLWGYPASYLVCAGLQALAVPFVWLAGRQRAKSDPISGRSAVRP
jgi:MFS family permease